MKKILTIATLILLTAGCTHHHSPKGEINADRCMEHREQKQEESMRQMQGHGMMKEGSMKKQMMQQDKAGSASTKAVASTPGKKPAFSQKEHEQHHPK